MRFFLVAAFVLLTSAVQAADVYVHYTDGTDGSGCGSTDSNPCKLISYAVLNELSAGETLYLARGETWTGANEGIGTATMLDLDMGGTITIEAYGTGADPILDRSADSGGTSSKTRDVSIIFRTDNTELIVTGVDFRAASNAFAIYEYQGGDVEIYSCSFQGAGYASEGLIRIDDGTVIVEDSTFDMSTGNSVGYDKGVEANDTTSAIFRDNTFTGIGGHGGIFMAGCWRGSGSGNVIERNYFTEPDTAQSYQWPITIRGISPCGQSAEMVIRNNVFDITGSGGGNTIILVFYYMDYHTSADIYLHNNTFVGDGVGYGIKGGDSGVITLDAFNNIFYDLGTVGDNMAIGSDNVFRNNIMYSYNTLWEDGAPTEYNTVTTDPALADDTMAAVTGAMLTASSTNVIDAGYSTGSYIPTDDYRGNARSNVDIGAFEYGSVPSGSRLSAPADFSTQ